MTALLPAFYLVIRDTLVARQCRRVRSELESEGRTSRTPASRHDLEHARCRDVVHVMYWSQHKPFRAPKSREIKRIY